jgi:hypothetical protein
MAETFQMPFCPSDVDLGNVVPHPVLALVQHMQEHDFTIERLGEAIRQLEDFQWTLRQIDRQQ